MNRDEAKKGGLICNFLYARGDEPVTQNDFTDHIRFSLRTWRWTAWTIRLRKRSQIFSTHVEMNRYQKRWAAAKTDFLYARGDEPYFYVIKKLKSQFSLRTWRWTVPEVRIDVRGQIFSTHVEMNRYSLFFNRRDVNFLYARGDEPWANRSRWRAPKFSLRTWRWTGCKRYSELKIMIFSTHVEMNRPNNFRILMRPDFLYARGDEPRAAFARGLRRRFSLRTWRWTEIEDSIKLHGITFSNFNTRLAIEQSSNFYLL